MDWRLENVNFMRDRRNRDVQLPMLEDEQGNEVQLPVKWAVCPICDGAGTHVNPNIDCGGLDEEAMADDEFMENYRGGMYDVQCNGCGGRTTIQVVDEDRLEPAVKKLLEAHYRAEAEDRAWALAEARMGA